MQMQFAKSMSDCQTKIPRQSSQAGAGNCERRRMVLWMLRLRWGEHRAQVWEAGGFSRGVASPCHFFHKGLQTYILVHGDDFYIVDRREGRKHALSLLRSAHELSKVVSLSPESSQSRPDQQHVSRALLALGLTDATGVATPGTDDVGGAKASQISELRRTAKWHDPLEEVREEDDLLFGQELKLFQSVAARFNFLAVDRPDLLYSVKELVWKMASPRTQDLTALKRVARYTIKYPRMTCRYPWTELDNNIEVFGDANFAGCTSTRASTVGGVAMWSGQFVKAWSETMECNCR